MSPVSVEGVEMGDMHQEDWVWDTDHKSSNVVLSPNHQAAYFHVSPLLESTGTAGKCQEFIFSCLFIHNNL